MTLFSRALNEQLSLPPSVGKKQRKNIKIPRGTLFYPVVETRLMKQALYQAVLLALVISTSCKKPADNDPQNPAPANPAREEYNIAYGNHQRQKMDVYFPEGYNENTPVVFLMHGGGFVAGSKESFNSQATTFRAKGYITVNLSYRLVDTTGLLSLPPVHKPSEVKISGQLADVHAAVSKYKTLSADWKTGTSKMFMAGHSAGAILATLYTQGDYNDDNHIKACGNWAGLTDFTIPHDSLLDTLDPRYLELLYRAAGAMPSTTNQLAFMAISPYWVANLNGGRPTISIYPENNVVIKVNGEAAYGLDRHKKYHELLKSKGVREKLVVYPGHDHGFSNPGAWEKLISETADFFNTN